jgi:hypothetical protein
MSLLVFKEYHVEEETKLKSNFSFSFKKIFLVVKLNKKRKRKTNSSLGWGGCLSMDLILCVSIGR